MKILVLGGTRYFGKLIVERLLDEGHSVTIFTRGNRRPEFLRRVTHLIGDRRDADAFHEMFRRHEFDAVIDNNGYRPEEVETSLETFRESTGLYVFTSSSAVYLDQYLHRRFLREEDAAPDGVCETFDSQTYQYAVSKMRCEQRLRAVDSMPHVILRPPIVVGPEDFALRVYFFVQRILDGGPILLPRLPELRLRHVYSQDLASVYVRLLERSSCWNQTYNVAAKEVLGAEQYLGFIAGHMGMDLRIVYIDPEDLQTARYSQPFLFNQILSLERFETDVGGPLTDFETFMGRTVDWFLREYEGADSSGYDRRGHELELATRFGDEGNEAPTSRS